MTYYLYEHDTHRWVMIHKGECRHCNHGQGTQPYVQGIASRWHGVYETYNEANAAALSLKDDVYPCRVCFPEAG